VAGKRNVIGQSDELPVRLFSHGFGEFHCEHHFGLCLLLCCQPWKNAGLLHRVSGKSRISGPVNLSKQCKWTTNINKQGQKGQQQKRLWQF
jgi:hypothetical protein